MSQKNRILSFLVVVSMLAVNSAPVFAQLETITVPPPPPPIDSPSPASISPTPPAETLPIIPPADTTAPVISGVASLSLGIADATIFWITDEPTISTLEYGTTESYGTQATLGASALLAHTAVLVGLTPNTTYHYCIHATDLSTNTANSCGHTFTTAAEPVIADTTPPDVILITETSVTISSIVINFTTSEVGNSRIEYGTTAGYGETTPLDTNLALNHSVTLSNLTPNTEYHFRIISSDEIGNETITSDETFTTEAEAVVQQGEVSITVPESTNASTTVVSANASVIISGIEIASVSLSEVTIAWSTDLPSDSQVEYGDSNDLGSFTTLDSTLTTSHSVTITGLTQNTNYIFRVKSKQLGAEIATVSDNHEFNTLNHSVPVVAPANVISVSSSQVTNSGATISWTTDKSTTSQVEYGISTSYGQTSELNTGMVTSNSISLVSLESGTRYHFRVKSTDEVYNITYSDDHILTTTIVSQNGYTSQNIDASSNIPALVTTLAVGSYDQRSVSLSWHVASSTSDVTALYDIRFSALPIIESL